VLSDVANMGLPDAIGIWVLDQLLGNPVRDYVADTLKDAKAKFASDEKRYSKQANPRPFPSLAPLSGSFGSNVFGKAAVRPEGDTLVLKLQETGAELALAPWDGDVFTFRVLPRGRFAHLVAGMGPRPRGFAQFESDQDGKLGVLRLTLDDGQSFEFRRE
jgi:hypothetical protein